MKNSEEKTRICQAVKRHGICIFMWQLHTDINEAPVQRLG